MTCRCFEPRRSTDRRGEEVDVCTADVPLGSWAVSHNERIEDAPVKLHYHNGRGKNGAARLADYRRLAESPRFHSFAFITCY